MSSPTITANNGNTHTHRRPGYSFTPSRPAPPPPIYSQYATGTSPSPRARARSVSSVSVDSATTLCTPSQSPTSYRMVRQTSPLNTPLTPPRSRSYPPPPLSHPSAPLSYPLPPRERETRVWYSTPPPDLSLFDHRPRQTLLSDLEVIFGKKLHFPFLGKRGSSSDSSTSPKTGGKLKKEKHISEYEMFWSAAQIGTKEKKKGRGVREGNWI